MTAVLTEFIQILVAGISELATGIGSGTNQFIRDLFFTVGTDGAIAGLSAFGGTVAIFGGVALSTGITALVFHWIRRMGK